MVVKLKVMHGPSAGKEIKVPKGPFAIGRGDECQLRPKSDAISRKHCELVVGDEQAIVRDLDSKNGTYVNGDKVQGDRVLKLGDHLKVGPLEFEVMIDFGITGDKLPKVTSVKDAAMRSGDSSVVDEEISAWLSGDLPAVTRAAPPMDAETRQFKLEDTDRVALTKRDDKEAAQDSSKSGESPSEIRKRPEKKEPGKLPPRQEATLATSRDAAADALKKFFNRR